MEKKKTTFVVDGKAITLTNKNMEFLDLLSAGASNSDIAQKFGSNNTAVTSILHLMYVKLKVKNRLEAVLWWNENNPNKKTSKMTDELREILLNSLAIAWLSKEIFKTVDEYMDAVRQVKEMK